MRKHFDDQIAQLGEQMMAMGALVENTIERAIRALQTDDMAEAAAIRDGDHIVDEKEREVEAMCIHMLLQQQPVARDLRQISAALKMITDMERIGDQAEDIAEIIAFLEDRQAENDAVFREMARAVIQMVTESVDAYVKCDIILAKKVIADDDYVDDCFARIKQSLISRIAAVPTEGEYALDLLMIAKYYERIGDHATNIGEWAEFSVDGIHRNGDSISDLFNPDSL